LLKGTSGTTTTASTTCRKFVYQKIIKKAGRASGPTTKIVKFYIFFSFYLLFPPVPHIRPIPLLLPRRDHHDQYQQNFHCKARVLTTTTTAHHSCCYFHCYFFC
jgi:hypothetical protein